MIYEKATAEVILFDNSDVIRTSGTGCNTMDSNNAHICPNASTATGGPGLASVESARANRRNRS